MRKTILVGAALLACAAPAAAHNAGATIDCDGAQISYSYFPTYMDSTMSWDITIDGVSTYTGSRTIRRSGVITIPFDPAVAGNRDAVFNITWLSDTNGGRIIRTTLDCPVPEPPVVPPAPPVAPEPPVDPTPPQVTTPTTPTPPVPPKPRVKTCAELKAAGAGRKWLERRGCVKPIKRCPSWKYRVVVNGKTYCLLNPPYRPGKPIPVAG